MIRPCLRPYIIFLSLILFCFPVFQISAIENISSDIRVTSQREGENKYDTVRGVVYLKTSIKTIKSVLTDQEACLKWMYQCKHSQIIKTNSDYTKGYVYFIYKAPKLPWYLLFVPKPDDREMVLKIELIEERASGKLLFTLNDVNPALEPDLEDVLIPSDSSLVKIKTLTIKWEIMPVEDDYLQVTLQVYSDPNHKGKDLGIIDRNTNEMVKRTLQNFRDLIEERKVKP